MAWSGPIDPLTSVTHSGDTSYMKALLGLVLAAFLAPACASDESLALWPFQEASISPDGTSLEVLPYARPDTRCYEYDHIDTRVQDSTLVVSLYYQRTSQEFCQIPCPLGVESPHLASLDPPVSPSLVPVRDPATPEHCSES